MPLPPGAVQSIGQTLESLVQGLYFSAFYRCCIVLLAERKRRVPYLLLGGMSSLLFVTVTTHFIAGVFQNIQDINDPYPVYTIPIRLRDYSFIVSTVVASSFMVYRCFIVWNRWRRIVVLPSILCLACFGLGIWLVIACSREGLPLFRTSIVPKIFCTLTLALNLATSGLILYRIWGVQREISRVVDSGNRFVRRTTSLLIESGALYSIMLVGLIVASHISYTVTGVISGCVVPLLGLAVSAIILRIGKGISHGDPVTSIPIEFRNSAFSNNAKGSYLPNSLPTGGLDHELEVGQAASRLRFDLTN